MSNILYAPRSWLLSLLALIACLFAGLAILMTPSTAFAQGDPLRSQQYGLDIIESDAAHRTTTGKGAVIAIIDTGVLATHPDLQGGRLLQGRDFVDDDNTPQDDVDGHGTHVLGIAGATTGNDIGVSSVAPGAKLLPVRVLDNQGSGSIADVVKGIDYAVREGAHVINLSLGGSVPAAISSSPQFDAAIDRALDAGRVVIAAAGNDGFPACNQPSGEGRLLCVGSVDENRMRSLFSNFSGNSEALGIMAPGGSGFFGSDILSTFNNGGYTELAGTSQATPHVAGVAALLVERGLRGQAVTSRLLATASDAGVPGPDGEYGAGIVNARRAVEGLPAQDNSGGGGENSVDGAASVSLRRSLPIRRALRRGVRARCHNQDAGRCTLIAFRRGKRLAAGSVLVARSSSRVVAARANRRGRVLLRRAQRHERKLTVRVRITLPGLATQYRRLLLRP